MIRCRHKYFATQLTTSIFSPIFGYTRSTADNVYLIQKRFYADFWNRGDVPWDQPFRSKNGFRLSGNLLTRDADKSALTSDEENNISAQKSLWNILICFMNTFKVKFYYLKINNPDDKARVLRHSTIIIQKFEELISLTNPHFLLRSEPTVPSSRGQLLTLESVVMTTKSNTRLNYKLFRPPSVTHSQPRCVLATYIWPIEQLEVDSIQIG